MPESKSEKKPEVKKQQDPRLAQRAERLAKAGPGAKPADAAAYVKDTRAELKKTHWPDREVLTKSTYVVLMFIVATAIWVGGVDRILGVVTAKIFVTH
jgi:preprotein translocase SecE subunit